jgi:hypothetical protein
MADSKVKKIVEEIVADVVENAVKEVDGKECVCGVWKLRISRTPKIPAPAKTEDSLKVESNVSPQNGVDVV